MGQAARRAGVTDAMLDFLERITDSSKPESRGAHMALRWLSSSGYGPNVGAGFMLGYCVALLKHLIVMKHPSSESLARELPQVQEACLRALAEARVERPSAVMDALSSLEGNALPDFARTTKMLVQTHVHTI